MNINRLNIKSITRHAYRTAMVKKIITISRKSEEGVELERWLNNSTNNTPDNHVCFDIEENGGNHLYIMCTDMAIHIGTSLIIRNW